MDLPDRYLVMSGEVNQAWTRNAARAPAGPKPTASPAPYGSCRALRRHPHLRVLAASGRNDLGTPYSASDWSLAQLDVAGRRAPDASPTGITMRVMFYTRSDDLRLQVGLADRLAQA